MWYRPTYCVNGRCKLGSRPHPRLNRGRTWGPAGALQAVVETSILNAPSQRRLVRFHESTVGLLSVVGLEKGSVALAEHDPAWRSLFAAESRVIRDAGGELIRDLQHVGSTAVRGLPAKPIVDIAIAVDTRAAIPVLVQRLTAVGYIDRGDQGRDGGYLLVRESRPRVRTIHVHIVELSDVQWRNYIAFRDILRWNRTIRDEYARLKRQLAARFQDDSKSYTASKNDFIRGVLRLTEAPGNRFPATE